MKQHITNDQVNKLSDKAAVTLRKWMESKGYVVVKSPVEVYYPLLSIGQMIEFLFEQRKGTPKQVDFIKLSYDPCDALWQGVKEVLEQQP